MSIATLLGFKQSLDTARSTPSQPRLVEWIENPRISEDPQPALVDGAPFEAGTCYFALRLAGLHLKDARRYAQQMLPLCVCLAEFRRGGKRETVPFSLGPDTIRQRLQVAQPDKKDDDKPRSGWVELRDIEIVRPTPVSQTNIEAFIGVYAVPGDDIAKTLLNVMGTISQAFGGTLSPALAIAEKVYDGFTSLLGVKGVTPEVEALHGNLLRKSGYLLVSNAPEDSPVKGKLFVSGGRLRHGAETTSRLVTDFDYCLVSVQRLETLVDANSTAPDLFGTQWQEVIEAFDGEPGTAAAAFRKLQRAVYGSTQLIPRDRDALVAGYLVEYDKAARVFGKEPAPAGTTRGAVLDGVVGAVTEFTEVYEALTAGERASVSEQQKAELKSGSSAWKRASELLPALAKQPVGLVSDRIFQAVQFTGG